MKSAVTRSCYPGWWRDFGLFALATVYPSLALFKKVGWLPLAVYAAMALLGLFLWLRYLLPVLAERLTTRLCVGATLVSFVGLAVAMAVVFPAIQREHGFQLLGIKFGVSDSNDAYVATWRAFFAGEYLYSAKSFLGNPISPMPGAQLLALPFYAAGCTVAQNWCWLVLGWYLVARGTGNFRLVSLALLTALGACPDAIYSLLAGWDYLTNSIYILLPVLGLLAAARNRSSRLRSLGIAGLLGLGLSSRANYLLLVPVLFFTLRNLRDTRYALEHVAVCVAVFALVTVPVYLWNPAQFSPLTTSAKLNVGGFTHASSSVFLVGSLWAMWLGWSQTGTTPLHVTLKRCSYVQYFAVISGLVLGSVALGKPNLEYPHFGLLAMLFGVAATAPRLFTAALAAKPLPTG